MLMVQLNPAATLLPQVVEVGWTAKSPPATILEMARVVPVSLNSVTPRGALVEPKLCVGKVRTAGDKTTVVPRPERKTKRGLSGELVVIVISPDAEPSAVGVNVMLIVQLAWAAKLVPQLLVCAKSPVGKMLVMLTAVDPVFVKVTGWDGLVIPRPS